MLASELAMELELDSGIVSRLLRRYYFATQTPKPAKGHHGADACDAVRRSCVTYMESGAQTWEQAMDMALGKWEPPIESAQALQIRQTNEELLARMTALETQMDTIASYLRKLLGRREQQTEVGGERREIGNARPEDATTASLAGQISPQLQDHIEPTES